MDSELFIREMQLKDLEAAMRLKTVEGWNQTEADWQLILADNLIYVSSYWQKMRLWVLFVLIVTKVNWPG